ncbi:MAG: sugar phosphate isomerase/epimerase [Gemmatimonadetes bacterium]|nr:sugar phosphate isomerase/epimerase [Gemmatimonadota bacterium]MYJ90697.1 sugar phosphate isomerase/epimerase [Gemmatimonadota bacterium]
MNHLGFMLIDPPSGWGGSVDETFRYIRSIGYDGVELNLTPELAGLLDQVEDAARANELPVVSLLTGAAYGEGLCLSVPDASIRDRTVERLVDNMETANRFGAILVVGLLQGLRSDEPDPAVAQARIVSCLRRVGREAEGRGVEIVIEPVNHLQVGFNNSVGEVLRLIRDTGSTAFHPMVDTIHMNIEETSLIQPIHDCGARLRHVHLCESHGGLPGTGRIDFAAVLDALEDVGYPHFASVKVYRKVGLRDAAEQSMAFFRELKPG